MEYPLRLILADDHASIREGLRALLTAIPGVTVVADVSDVESAIAQVRALEPDMLLLDLAMPKSGGLTALRQLMAENAPTAVVVLTRYREAAFVTEAMAAGASAYVLKQSPFSELLEALEHVSRGDQYLDRHLETTIQRPAGALGRLTQREREVLRRAALGHSNKELADALSIAVKTVEVHKTRAMRKLGLVDRKALVRYATLQGWIREP